MKKLTLLLVTICLIFTALGSGLMSVAFASEAGIDDSNVLNDLTNSTIAGENFDIDNYGYTSERETSLLAFAEYGFAFNKSNSDYNIYIYLYNPSGREIKATRNSITVATVYENGNAADYGKFALKLLSVSDGKYARLFYKFKIADPTDLYTRVAANTNLRRYDVSEIELNYGAETNEAYTVSNYWEYSGYAQGFGADSTAESSLTCTSDCIDTVKLNVQNTNYRYYNNEPATDLSSVYFGIPDEMFTKYGKLQQIKASWFETKAATQFVFTNKTLYDHCTNNLGKVFKDMPTVQIDDRNVNYLYYKDSSEMARVNSKIYWNFYDRQGNIPPSTVLEYATNYTKQHGGELLIDKYSKVLFVEAADTGRKYGWQETVIDADSTFDINGFNVGSKFWNWFFTHIYHYETEDIKDIAPIYIVKESDLQGTNFEVAERLLICEEDVKALKDTFRQNALENKKTVLLRYATTAYSVREIKANLVKNDVDIPLIVDKDVGYVVQQTVFLDFDIIYLRFLKEAQSTVIPCVSSPIDVFHGLTPPPTTARNIWAIIAGVVVIILLLIVLFIPVRFKKKRKGGKK